MESIRLNIFQRLTIQWDRLHPYNAAQAMRIRGIADIARISAAWRGTISGTELERLRLDSTMARLAGEPELRGRDLDVEVHEGPIETFFTDSLNRAFDEARKGPFRPFVVRESDGSYWLGLSYHHWVADSFSVRLILREWFAKAVFDQDATKKRLRVARGGYRRHFASLSGRWTLIGAALDLARWSAAFRRVQRLRPEAQRDLHVHFALHRAPDGLIDRLVIEARKRQVTVNDLFLAAIAKVCDEFVPLQQIPGRTNLAVGTIVDLRPGARPSVGDAVGLFLGFTSVVCTPHDLAEPSRLIRTIHEQNVRQRAKASAEASVLRMIAGLSAGRLIRNRERLLEFYRKRVALTAGISNVNLNRDWPALKHPLPLMDYVRVSPAGPMMPVVFTPTTLGRSLNVGLTCRKSVLAPEQARRMACRFVEHLETFCAADLR